MVAFSFSEQFAGPVSRREKLQTIRQTRRAKIGDKIQLYTGMRADYEAMLAWFQGRYGQPTFIGYLHRWEFQ